MTNDMEGKLGRVLVLGVFIALAILVSAFVRRGSDHGSLEEIAQEARRTRAFFES